MFIGYISKNIIQKKSSKSLYLTSLWCHQESNNTIQSPNLQHFNIFGKIPEPLNQPYAKFTNFR